MVAWRRSRDTDIEPRPIPTTARSCPHIDGYTSFFEPAALRHRSFLSAILQHPDIFRVSAKSEARPNNYIGSQYDLLIRNTSVDGA
jgi:hypothetical protein